MTLVADFQLDAAVLRNAALGDVEARHDLEAGDQRRPHLDGRLHDLLERAVDAVADAQLLLEALEVNVRRAFLERIGHDGVDKLDDRRFVDERAAGIVGGCLRSSLSRISMSSSSSISASRFSICASPDE